MPPLLEQILVESLDSRSSLGWLLQKCKVLAARLKNEQLEQWLSNELVGYPEDVAVPDYRIWKVDVKGHFYGPAGEALRNAPVPSPLIPNDVRDWVTHFRCRHSIGSIEETLAAEDSRKLQVPIAELASLLGADVYAHRVCAQAWIEFERTRLAEVSDVVRRRMLDFALQLWKVEPLAGEPGTDVGGLCIEKVNAIFDATLLRRSS